ncbi:MAG: hypothetical protein ACE5IK_14420 [Acidobacteriota bacterium]
MHPHQASSLPEHLRGFSLVETLVGVTLLAGLVTGMIRLTIDAAKSVERSARITEAGAWARIVLDRLQQVDRGNSWVAEGGSIDRPLAGAGGTWFVDVGPLQARWQVDSYEPAVRLLRLDVVVVDTRRSSSNPPLAHLVGVRRSAP